MRPKDITRARVMHQSLVEYPLKGLPDAAHRDSFVEQLVESLRRIEYVRLMAVRQHSPERGQPESLIFDPLLAAVLAKRAGDLDEACWLVFLSVHCGRHLNHRWRLARLIYGGSGKRWTWDRVSRDPTEFSEWLAENAERLRLNGRYGFGNHRKYETLNPRSQRNTGRVVETYVAWILKESNHEGLLRNATAVGANDRFKAFDHLFHSIGDVISFGRMARFDYLTMLGKLGLADIEPGKPYMRGATGPMRGARLLFGGTQDAKLSSDQLDRLTVKLGRRLNVGMQAMEDAICNWQKSPGKFHPFRG